MAQRAIREYDGKRLLSRHWKKYIGETIHYSFSDLLVQSGEALRDLFTDKNALLSDRGGLVVKPDMLFGKRGLNELVYYKNKKVGDITIEEAAQWIDQKKKGETQLLTGESGLLTHFLVMPFVAHSEEEEYYVSMVCEEDTDIIYLSAKGGIHIEENWDQVTAIPIPLQADRPQISSIVGNGVRSTFQNQSVVIEFITGLYLMFRDLHFSYLEINPFVIQGQEIFLLDLVARMDDTAGYLMAEQWGALTFPTPFGVRALSKEENDIRTIDQKSGASLKLTLLNPEGRIWTLVAGGGASVVYADTVVKYADPSELANYGEYSGNPSSEETFYYTRTILDLMTRGKRHPKGKVLLIGGAIANFTDVAVTFRGIIKAMEEMTAQMTRAGVKVYVRRGGPNYREGLKQMKAAGERLKIPIQVYSPETHLTDIVRIALKA